MAKKNQAAAPAAEKADNIGAAETVEAVEPASPEGVETTEEEAAAPAAESAAPVAGCFAVQWHIKFNGRRYGPGEAVELTDEQAAPFLASGAIVKA